MIGLIIAACNKTTQPDPVCPGGTFDNCHGGAWALWENDCKCTCRPIPGFNIVDAGNAFCVVSGSYVSYFKNIDAHMDTFSIKFPDFGPNGEARNPVQVKMIAWNSHSFPMGLPQGDGGTFNIPTPISKPEGDSIRINFFEAVDGSFSTQSLVPNRYSDTQWYSLRFEGWVPGGINKGKTMYATMHYLLGGGINFPVRPPVSFEMTMVE